MLGVPPLAGSYFLGSVQKVSSPNAHERVHQAADVRSFNQMDNFYQALARGEVKASGVMNYIQHLYIALRCPENASVLDMCCGRGLQLPLLARYSPSLGSYVGIDLAEAALAEAELTLRDLRKNYRLSFPVSFYRCDVSDPSLARLGKFDVVVYTSALEHMPRDKGAESLRNAATCLADSGRLYLSTPRTPRDAIRRLQYSVHVYEWDRAELEAVLTSAGLDIVDCFGLLPPDTDIAVVNSLRRRYGDGAVSWYRAMEARVPCQFIATTVAVAFPDIARELMFVCRKP